ncbi:MAG: endospore germination permease [Peptococcaceae bacterium]|nr:endospore germination permease [Peptococcaceae bacterium]
MLTDERISTRQLIFLLFCLAIGSMLFTLPKMMINQAQQDVWLVLLLSLFFDSCFGVIIYVLSLRHPNQTMVQYCETLFGKWLGKLAGLVFVIYFAGISIQILMVVVDYLATVMMPETPKLAFSLLILLICAYTVDAGLEVIARVSEVIAPVIVGSLCLIITLSINNVHLEYLEPVFQHTFGEIVQSSFLPTTWLGNLIVAGMLLPQHNNKHKTLLAILAATTAIVVGLMIILVETIAVIGVNLSSTQIYPIYRLVQMISVGDFLEHVESLLVIIWVAGSFIGVILTNYCSTLGLEQVTGLTHKHRLLTIINGGVLLLVTTLAFPSVAARQYFVVNTLPYLTIMVEGLLLGLLLLVSLLRLRQS